MTPLVNDPGKIHLRCQALLLLDNRGELLETARSVSQAMTAASLSAAVIGGIAVVLHGHSRTTKDIDIFVNGPLPPVVDVLEAMGFTLNSERRELRRDEIPIHLVTVEQTRIAPSSRIEIEGIVTVELADLIAMKLRSGLKNLLRAQDLADVIGLVRCRNLGSGFASKLPKDLRPEYREIVWALAAEKR